jgi:hypothetical protein
MGESLRLERRPIWSSIRSFQLISKNSSRPKLQRLGDVRRDNDVACSKVGDRSGNAKDAMVSASREIQ